MFSCGALPRSRDRGRPLGLATATGLRAGRSIPSEPPLLLAGGASKRCRKQARAFWWGARSALGALGLVTVQTDNPVTENVAPALSSSCAAHAPVTKYLAPTPDVTYALRAPFTDCVAPAPVIGYIALARAAPCSRDFSEASTPMVVGSLLRLEGIAAPAFSQVYQEQIVARETTQNIVAPVQYAAPTMTRTCVDVNRNGTPDVLQQPQSGLAPQGVVTPAQYEAPVKMGTMTVTGVDMNRDGIPDVLQQPQIGIAPQGFAAPIHCGAPANMRRPASGPAPVTEQPHQPLQGDLTIEERDDLTVLLIAVRDELLDRDEDPALLVYQLMDQLLDADTSEIADVARATIPRLHHLWCGTARRFDLTIDDSDEDVSDEDDGIAAFIRALPVGTQWRPSSGPGPGLHCVVAVRGRVNCLKD